MTVTVHTPEMISKDELFIHPDNSNEQDKHVFAETRKSIRENGFDENMLVVPRKEEGFGYWIVSGNHRFKAGCAEGMEEFPCVVHSDWDEAKEQIELVRRNLIRGNINKDKFTVAVDTLAESRSMAVDDIRSEMGFEDSDKFLEYYKQQSEREVQQEQERQRSENGPKVKMIDDLGMVLSSIFENYGDTVDKSFIIFPASGRRHMYVAATPALRRLLTEVAERCIADNMDINMVLGGLLAIGLENSQFRKDPDVEHIIEKGTEEGSDDFE